MFDRNYVYEACLLAASKGIEVGSFGNACDRTNKGEFQSEFYQNIAKTYGEEAQKLGDEECWKRYCDRAKPTQKERKYIVTVVVKMEVEVYASTPTIASDDATEWVQEQVREIDPSPRFASYSVEKVRRYRDV